jgi:hypothetical protein
LKLCVGNTTPTYRNCYYTTLWRSICQAIRNCLTRSVTYCCPQACVLCTSMDGPAQRSVSLHVYHSAPAETSDVGPAWVSPKKTCPDAGAPPTSHPQLAVRLTFFQGPQMSPSTAAADRGVSGRQASGACERKKAQPCNPGAPAPLQWSYWSGPPRRMCGCPVEDLSLQKCRHGRHPFARLCSPRSSPFKGLVSSPTTTKRCS